MSHRPRHRLKDSRNGRYGVTQPRGQPLKALEYSGCIRDQTKNVIGESKRVKESSHE